MTRNKEIRQVDEFKLESGTKDNNNLRRIDKSKFIYIPFFVTLSILFSLFMVTTIRFQNVGRVINYAGLVRGGTQRLVKITVFGDKNNYNPISDIDKILDGLINGSKTLKLAKLPNKDYNNSLQELNELWEKVKKAVYVYNENPSTTDDLLELSEKHFIAADKTVSIAEEYSTQLSERLQILEIISIVVLLLLFIVIVKDVIESFRLYNDNKSLGNKAYTDAHTKIPNKNRCEQIFGDVSEIKIPTAVMMFDLNNLKKVNDTLGHTAGDIMILNFANILRNEIPEKQFVGRYGGDEFVSVLQNVNEDDVKMIISNIQRAVDSFNHQGIKPFISFAVGYELSTSFEHSTLKVLLNKADYKMYINKNDVKAKQIKEDSVIQP